MEERVPIANENLEERVSLVQPRTNAQPHTNAPKIGPGFWESVAWTVGLIVMQVVATVFALVGITFVQFVIEFSGLDQFGREFPGSLSPSAEISDQAWLILVAQAASVLYAAFAIRVRYGSAGFRSLGWQFPSIAEVFATLLIAMPMLLIGSSLVGAVTASYPELDWGLRTLQGQIAAVPIWLSVVSIAVFPAVGEELFARGLIGRGLTTRYPTWLGVLLTSLLFAAMHLNPAQSLAVIPLGIVLHILYLISRSMWLPMLLHFANNFFSILFLISRQAEVLPEWTRDQSGVAPVGLLVVSAGLVMTALLWLRELRRLGVEDLANPNVLAPAMDSTDPQAQRSTIEAVVEQVRDVAAERAGRRRVVALLALALLIHVAGFLLLLSVP